MCSHQNFCLTRCSFIFTLKDFLASNANSHYSTLWISSAELYSGRMLTHHWDIFTLQTDSQSTVDPLEAVMRTEGRVDCRK